MNINKKDKIKKVGKNASVVCLSSKDKDTTLFKIQEEFHKGIEFVKSFNPSVTFYGSARLPETNPYYKKTRNLAYRISKELGYTILSGGGGGLMEAASRGAYEAGGKSVGLTINIRTEQKKNSYLTNEIPFNFFFSRQSLLSYSTEVCIFCPGGFGTLSELFDILTLQQTEKIDRFPIILIGSDYWNPIEKIIKEILLEKYNTINESEYNLCTITDDDDLIIEIIKNSKIRDGKESLK